MGERVRIDVEPRADVREGYSLCWHCREELDGGPICPRCVKIQPLGGQSDHFSVMGLPRKLSIDPRVLEPVFHALSRRFHPDMYRLSTPRERMIALENSALLNQAYRALRDPFERAAYLLQLEEGRASETKPAAPRELFDEILEVQELLAEFKLADPDEREALRSRLGEKQAELQAEQDRRAETLTGRLFREWDALQEEEAPPSPERKAPLLGEMRRILDERAYLRRVLKTLDEALAGSGG